jgi:hypothetical protein
VAFYVRFLPLVGVLGGTSAVLGTILAVRAWTLSDTSKWVMRWVMLALWCLLVEALLGLALARDTQPGPAELLALATQWADILRVGFAYTTDTWPVPLWNGVWFVLLQTALHGLLLGLSHERFIGGCLAIIGLNDVSAEISSAVIRTIVRNLVVMPVAMIQLIGILLPVAN